MTPSFAAAGDVIYNEGGEVYLNGTPIIVSALTGLYINNMDGQVKITGAHTLTLAGKVYYAYGNCTKGWFGGIITVGACSLAVDQIVHDADAEGFFNDDVIMPAQNYGQGSIWAIIDGSRVRWNGILTDGSGASNRNTNAAGYGVRIKRGATLNMRGGGGGPDGVLSDVDLGGVGATAYPAAGVSATDITNGGEPASQMCAIHSR